MADEPAQKRPIASIALLALAIVAALGVGAFLFTSGSSDEPASPEEVTRSLYAAVAADDAASFTKFLDPALRDSPTRSLIPFRDSIGSYNVGSGTKPRLTELAFRPVNNESGWATVSSRGLVATGGEPRAFNETIYLRQQAGKWLVSSESEFVRSQSGGATPAAVTGLGPLVPQRPKDGALAPDFALVDARDGVTVRKLSDFRGKAVILNWYASWCGPCKAEIPEFQDAYAALGDQLVVIGVDYLESQSRALGILDIFKAKYPALLDSTGSVGEHYRTTVLPSTFFIDKDGVLQATKYGQVRKEELADLLAKVGVVYVPK